MRKGTDAMAGDHLDVDELIVSQVDAIVDTTAKTLALNTFGFGTIHRKRLWQAVAEHARKACSDHVSIVDAI
jgi:hypothetical protein